jgi:exonuclease III
VNLLLDSSQVNDNTRSQLIDSAINKNKNENETSVFSHTNQVFKHRNACTTHLQDENNLTIFHQNICGLRTKTNEILCHLSSELPDILCFTEPHLAVSEIQSVCIDNYTLGAYYCRKQALKGGVCIFINNNQTSSTLNVGNYCVDKDIEVCVIQLNLSNKKFHILMIYRSPSGNFSHYMIHLEQIVQSLCNSKLDVIICGDININYLEELNRVKQLNTILKTYNLINTVTFPTRIGKTISTAIDSIFIDISKYDSHFITSLSNGLSDHESQLLTIVLPLNYENEYQKFSYRKISKSTVADFQLQLSHGN